MAKILLIEDDPDLCSIIEDALAAEHHMMEIVSTGSEGNDRLRVYKFDLVILDVGLPHMTGLEVLRNFRARGGKTPVLILTGKGAVQEKAEGLDAGADDYVTKPFAMKELSARVRALLRRPSAYTGAVLQAGDIDLDPISRRVTKNGAEINLLPKEFALLEFFMRHPNEVYSTDALLNHVWASESDSTPVSLRTCLTRLRQKIDVDGQPSIIRNLHGLGYKLEAQ